MRRDSSWRDERTTARSICCCCSGVGFSVGPGIAPAGPMRIIIAPPGPMPGEAAAFSGRSPLNPIVAPTLTMPPCGVSARMYLSGISTSSSTSAFI